MSINKVILIGRLGQDPELKYTPSGSAVCNFSMATSENWMDKSGQKQERTEWHRIIVWGKLGELCNQYLSKGRQVFVEGRIQTRSWEGRDGVKRYTTEINAANVQFLGGQPSSSAGNRNDYQYGSKNESGSNTSHAGDNNSSSGPMNQEYNISAEANFTADDIPF